MKLLLTEDNRILFTASDIQFGEYEGEEKWAIFDENDKILMYAIDANFSVADYSGEIPEDVQVYDKYLYQDGEIIRNPDYKEPEPTAEERIAELEAALADLLENIIPAMMGE